MGAPVRSVNSALRQEGVREEKSFDTVVQTQRLRFQIFCFSRGVETCPICIRTDEVGIEVPPMRGDAQTNADDVFFYPAWGLQTFYYRDFIIF